MAKKRLDREVQCGKCPWKKGVNPHEIPKGYSVERHCDLKKTIAEGGINIGTLNVMSCHESEVEHDYHCVGWLANQMGSGNNIGLRLSMLKYDLSRVKTIGPQHENFEDTLPKE